MGAHQDKRVFVSGAGRGIGAALARAFAAEGARVAVNDLDVNRWTRVTWQGVGRWKVDPLKDTQADRLEVQSGWSSPQRKAAERGVDFEDMLDEIEEAKRMIAERHLADVVSIGDVPEKVESTSTVATTEEEPSGDALAGDDEAVTKALRMRRLA